MKRIALCLSGQPRNVEKGFEYIKRNLIDCNDVDIFTHTWDTPADIGKDFINPTNNIKCGEAVDENLSDLILDLYSPTVAKFEEQIVFDEKDYGDRAFMGVKPAWILSMWYSIQAANQLQQQYSNDHGIQYDITIRTRFDWAINEPLVMEELIADTMICPRDCFSPDGFNDQFVAGPTSLVNSYSDLYNHIEEYYRFDRQPFCNEILLKHHLTKHHLKMQPIPIGYGLIRGADKIQWGKR